MIDRLRCLRDQHHATLRKHDHVSRMRTLRQQLLSDLFPLFSEALAPFHTLPHSDIPHHLPAILAQAQTFPLLTALQQEELATDLFYLVTQAHALLPPHLPFLKNGNAKVAALVSLQEAAFSSQDIQYWFPYMGDEERQMLFYSIESGARWGLQLLPLILDCAFLNESAVTALVDLLELDLPYSSFQSIRQVTQTALQKGYFPSLYFQGLCRLIEVYFLRNWPSQLIEQLNGHLTRSCFSLNLDMLAALTRASQVCLILKSDISLSLVVEEARRCLPTLQPDTVLLFHRYFLALMESNEQRIRRTFKEYRRPQYLTDFLDEVMLSE